MALKKKTHSDKDWYDFGFNSLNHATSEDKAHAKYSASGSDRWLSCPGSIALSEGVPEDEESAAAWEGTCAHACLEFLILNRKDLKKAVAKAKVHKKKDERTGKIITWNAQMIECALDELKYLEKRLKEYPGAVLKAESRVDASSFTMEDQFGTLDVEIAQEFGRLIIYDYKYGRFPVDPEENSQLIYYALAKAEEYGYNFAEVELIVGQPRSSEGASRRSWVTSMTYLLEEWFPRFKKGVEACEDYATAPLIAGDHCKFCPAAFQCPEISNKKLREAQVVFNDDVGVVEKLPALASIQMKNLPNVLDACDHIEKWIAAVRKHAFNVMERGEIVKGFKLVDKRSTRKWVNEEKVAAIAKTHFGSKAFSKPELLSPAQIEAAFKDNKVILPKVKDWVTKHTTNESSGFTMVREDDKRQAVNYIETVFKDDVFAISEKKNKKKGVRKMEQNPDIVLVEETPAGPMVTTKKVAKKVTKKAPAKKPVKTLSSKKTAKKATKKVVAKKRK